MNTTIARTLALIAVLGTVYLIAIHFVVNKAVEDVREDCKQNVEICQVFA